MFRNSILHSSISGSANSTTPHSLLNVVSPSLMVQSAPLTAHAARLISAALHYRLSAPHHPWMNTGTLSTQPLYMEKSSSSDDDTEDKERSSSAAPKDSSDQRSSSNSPQSGTYVPSQAFRSFYPDIKPETMTAHHVTSPLRPKNSGRESTAPLKAWLEGHINNPYPSKADKIMLAITTRMTLTQVSTWFANARRRLKKESGFYWTDDEDDDDTGSNDEAEIKRQGDLKDDSESLKGVSPPVITHGRADTLIQYNPSTQRGSCLDDDGAIRQHDVMDLSKTRTDCESPARNLIPITSKHPYSALPDGRSNKSDSRSNKAALKSVNQTVNPFRNTKNELKNFNKHRPICSKQKSCQAAKNQDFEGMHMDSFQCDSDTSDSINSSNRSTGVLDDIMGRSSPELDVIDVVNVDDDRPSPNHDEHSDKHHEHLDISSNESAHSDYDMSECVQRQAHKHTASPQEYPTDNEDDGERTKGISITAGTLGEQQQREDIRRAHSRKSHHQLYQEPLIFKNTCIEKSHKPCLKSHIDSTISVPPTKPRIWSLAEFALS